MKLVIEATTTIVGASVADPYADSPALGHSVERTFEEGAMYMKLVVGTILAGAILLAGAGVARSESATASTTVVRVKAKDFAFVLSQKSAPHGRIKFVITNPSPAVHDFAIAGHKSKLVQPGKSTTLVVTLKKGRYPYKCTVDSHAKLGMKGVLVVK
jgi:plastocyanin